MIVKINDLGINGEGIARTSDNKVCFVDFSLPNEVVDVDIYKDKSKFSCARVNSIIEQSPDRVAPKCKYFGVCGGCDLQHLNKLKQREFKKDKVALALRKVASKDIISNTEYSNEWGYRNKMVFVASGKPIKLGMVMKNSHDFVETKECLLASDIINKVLSVSSEYFYKSDFCGYDSISKTGDIKYIVIREFGDSVLVTVVSTKKINLKDYYITLNSAVKNVGLSMVISDSDKEILSGKYSHLYGSEFLEIEEFGINYKLNNLGFLQVNNDMKKKMYMQVLENIDDNDNVIDAYSGAGLLSAIISKKAKAVIGIEINKSASASAKELIKDNNISNCEFVCGDVAKCLEPSLKKFKDVTLVLDPTRSGCDKSVCDSILNNASKIKKIIYVSCNPSTLGRDLELLKDKFEVKRVIPYDLFPNTKHIETLVILKRK